MSRLSSILGGDVMMQLGSYQFSITTAAYQELTRTSEWRWPTQDRTNNTPRLQYTGKGADTIDLPGTIYPEWRGGWSQIEAMRIVADEGRPQLLVDGNGIIMGRWVIERIEERQNTFAARGVARKIEFTMSLRKYDDGADL